MRRKTSEPRKRESKSFQLCRCCCKWRCQCLIPRKKKPHPPFNATSKRDGKLGLHPLLMPQPPVSPPVGSYHPRRIRRIPGAISWKRQTETEEFSTAMGYTHFVQRELMRTGRGPGCHDIMRWPEDIVGEGCKSLRYDAGFGIVPRFQPSYKSITPGPGYTIGTHNPYYHLDKKRLQGFSCVPSFEYDGLMPRFPERIRSWSLACNRYKVKHPLSLQAFLEKVTSKRGPYDLFTGPRDETTIKGYWAPTKKDHNDWPRKLPEDIEKFWDRCNFFKGKWSIYPRFTRKPVIRMMLQDMSLCYKDPDEPGPGHYDPRELSKPTTLKRYPFDSNVEYARPPEPSDIRPGPGRYQIKDDYSIKGHGWSGVFKSLVPRTSGFVIPPSYSELY